MAITDMIPWKRKETEHEAEERSLALREDPILTFQQQMNRMFDEFLRGWGMEPFSGMREGWDMFSPHVDVTETDRKIKVSAELPGLSQEDVDVSLSRNVLTIRGEKKQEREQRAHSYLRTERSYGSFTRSIPLPAEVDTDEIDAVFRNGVLTVTLPKVEKREARKRITVKAS